MAGGGQVLDVQCAAGSDPGHPPPVAVLDPVGGGDDKTALVSAGDDHVAGTGRVPIGQGGFGPYWGPVGKEPVVAGAGVQDGDQVAGGGQHDRVQACPAVGQPRFVGRVGRSGQGPDVDPGVVQVEAETSLVPGPQRQAGCALGRVGEPGQLGKGDGTYGFGDITQDATGGHGSQLLVVADQPHGPAPARDVVHRSGQVGGPGHAGLVDDHKRFVVDVGDPCRFGVVGQGPGELGQGVGSYPDRLGQN